MRTVYTFGGGIHHDDPRAVDKTVGRRWYRKLVEDTLTGLRSALR